MVFGPPAQPYETMSQLNESVAQQWAIYSGAVTEMPPTDFPVWVDVRDLARLQVAALTNPRAKNQRYLACAGSFTNDESASIARAAFPEQSRRITQSSNSPAPAHYTVNASKAERDFGIQWIPFKKSVEDMARVLYEREAELAHN